MLLTQMFVACVLWLTLISGGQSDGSSVSDRVPGCTAYGHVYPGDGNVYWGGCPTFTCGAYPDECQWQENAAHTQVWCACLSRAVTADCKATATWAAGGDLAFWICKRANCNHSCAVAIIPFGVDATFPLCDC